MFVLTKVNLLTSERTEWLDRCTILGNELTEGVAAMSIIQLQAIIGDLAIRRSLPLTAGTLLLTALQPCAAHNAEPMPAAHPFHHSSNGLNDHNSFIAPLAPRPVSASFPSSITNTGVYNLDLSSAAKNIMLGSKMFGGAPGVTINVGGQALSFRPGEQVTAAEFVAIQEVLSHKDQTLQLDTQGIATGGSFSLNQADSVKVGELVIPVGVSAVDNFSANHSLTFTGDLTNDGSIYGTSSNGSVASGTIRAAVPLFPGRFMMLSEDLNGTFADLNPTQLIGFRNIERRILSNDMCAYTADFSLTHAMHAVQPLKQLVASKSDRCKVAATRLLKTAAIVSQLTGAGYQQVIHPGVAASAGGKDLNKIASK